MCGILSRRPCRPAMPRRCRRAVRAGSAGRVRDRSARRRSGRGRWWPSAREAFSPGRSSRTMAFMSSESHSSTTRSRPSRNSSSGPGVRPAVNTRTLRYGSSSAIRRAARTALFSPRSSMVAGIRLRLDSSSVSKSASRISPQSPCATRVWAMTWPTLSPATPIRSPPRRSCSSAVIRLRLRSSRRARKPQRAQHADDRTPPRVVGPPKWVRRRVPVSDRGSSRRRPASCSSRRSRNSTHGSARRSSRSRRSPASALVEDAAWQVVGSDVQFRAPAPSSRT